MRGVIYARYSSTGQREESVEGQLRECKDFAERKGITIVGSYIDRAISVVLLIKKWATKGPAMITS